LGKILGIDESGKGDFLGPLVIAGVLADEKGAEALQRAGVRDSKKIADAKILELSRWISASFPHTIVAIGPEKYNQLYMKIGNLNKLLAWGHSRVIENMALHHDIELAISDKFGRADFIEKALMEKGKGIILVQEERAESNMQVAAASILARAAFINYMKRLSDQYGMPFPKGAGDLVDRAAREFLNKYGKDELGKVAKLHFKNYKKATG
jgi:ribonuclease HIII